MATENFEETEEQRYKGEAEASEAEKREVGGEKTDTITNHLFQSDAEAQAMAEKLLKRCKGRKRYFRGPVDLCPVPIEINDIIQMQERITDLENLSYAYFGDPNYKYGDPNRKYRSDGVVIPYLGVVRDIKLDVTQTDQKLTIIMEVKND